MRSSNVRSSDVGPGCWAKKNESSIDNQFRKDPVSGMRSLSCPFWSIMDRNILDLVRYMYEDKIIDLGPSSWIKSMINYQMKN